MPGCCGNPPPFDQQPPDPEQYPVWGLWIGPTVLALLAVGVSVWYLLS